jgi:tRNA dimethylallyltransferase
VRLADECCAAIYRKNKLPAAAGGSGFYLKNFITGLPQTPPGDEQVRRALKEEYARQGLSTLYAELAERDPASAARIHGNDAYRIIRALAVCRETGKPLSAFEIEDEVEKKARREKYDFLVVYITRKRDELYARINRRVDAMFENGLVDEVKTLFSHSGYSEDNPLFTAIGYREFFCTDETGRFFLFDTPIDEIKELIKQNSRRYAKRQETFFNGIQNACRPDEVFRFVIDNDEDKVRKDIHALVRRFWENHHA